MWLCLNGHNRFYGYQKRVLSRRQKAGLESFKIYIQTRVSLVTPRVMKTLIKVISKWLGANTILNPKEEFKN
jgi:hypothetical protein